MKHTILFIPVSGPAGAGEYIRSLTIAQKLEQALDNVAIKFILNKHAQYIAEVPFPTVAIDGTPTLNVKAVKAIIENEQPQLCIIDSGGRTSLLKYLKKQNIPVVYISSRNSTRKKPFRWRWLKLVNQHWIVQPVFVNGPLKLIERLKISIANVNPPEFLETVFPVTVAERRKAFLKQIGLANKNYILFSSGGGGKRGDGAQAPDIFADAASLIQQKSGRHCVVLMGPNYPVDVPKTEAVITLKSVTNYHFIDLLHAADMVVLGGGSSLAQALVAKKLIVAAPAAADQQARINAAHKNHVVVPVNTNVSEIVSAVIDLISNQDKQKSLYTAIDKLGLNNGLEKVPQLVRRLLDQTLV